MAKRGPKPKHSLASVLAAATTIVAEQGQEALTMSAVARRLGSSVSGLYRYVDGQEELLVQLQQQAIEGYRNGLLAALAEAPICHPTQQPPSGVIELVSLLAFCDYYRIHASQHPARHSLLARFVASRGSLLSDRAARAVDGTLQNVLQLGVERLRAARLAGALAAGDDPQRLHLVWAALHGLDQLRKRDRIQPALLRSDVLFRSMLRTLLQGFGAKPQAVERAYAIYRNSAATSPSQTATSQTATS